ncbi:MAG: multicopper oxidase domain-containing protein [Clostridiales bacterium]|nr:multicopper oxidase domain-containing protein [Clostridiales bacterium]
MSENKSQTNKCFDEIDPSNPDNIPKFLDELPIPSVAVPKCVGKENCCNKENIYKITMREAYHRFHAFFPPTKIWGYNGMYPGPTIEAFKDISTYVEWANDLPSKHFLPFDNSLHGTMDEPEVKTVVHLHGANVADHSDGYPEAWYTAGYKITGSHFTRKEYEYTNHQGATTLWYHDHGMGVTRLNVYAGLAGFYFLRDVLEERLNLPKGKYEVPLLVQDKSFNSDGSLFYPDAPPFPVDVHPSIVPAFLGNTIVVNGKVWPKLTVEPRKYRFRVLNASNRRQYVFKLSNDEEITQIGTDGGFLAHSVKINSFKLLPSERTDIILDFSKFKGQKITLLNVAGDADENTGLIMQFNVLECLENEDTSSIPGSIRHDPALREDLVNIRRFIPLEIGQDHYNRPMLMLDGKMWNDPVSEKPELDTIEEWNIINPTFLNHPIHIHLIQFKILGRTPFDVQKYTNEGILEFTGPMVPPHDYETGFKDTCDAEVGMVTKLIMHFTGFYGNYVWHCHFLEHEDHDMMRPMKVIDNSFKAE